MDSRNCSTVTQSGMVITGDVMAADTGTALSAAFIVVRLLGRPG